MLKVWLLPSLVLIMAAGSGAATPAPAHLVTLGPVLVNAAALPSGTTIHDGDRVTTGGRSTALILSPDRGRVEVRNDSEVVFASSHVLLRRGVVGTTGTPVRLGRYTIEPQTLAGDTWVVVARSTPHPLVAVYRGMVRIVEPGAEPVLVSAGSYAVPAEPLAQDTRAGSALPGSAETSAGSPPPAGGVDAAGTVESSSTVTSGSTVEPSAPSGAAQPEWTLGGLSHAASVAVVTAAGATAVGAVVAAVALTEDSPSPSQ